MKEDIFAKEEKAERSLLKRYPFLKEMWKEREKIFSTAYKKEATIEKKYNKIAKESGLKSVKFAYNEYCFGIDVNDVDIHGRNVKEDRMLIHGLTFEKEPSRKLEEEKKEA